MTQEEAQTVLLDVLRDVQTISGREWTGLGADAKPIGGLDGFDSLSGVETTVMIEEKLGCRVEGESLFVSSDGKRALTVKEISQRISGLLGSREQAK